jgi:rhamnose transport system substrate-binding protein
MKTHRGMTLVIVVLALSMLLSACGAPATPAPAPAKPTEAAAKPAAPAGGAKTYVLVPKNLGNPYFDTANNGAQEAAKELGVTVNYQGPATADATQQIQLLNSLIAQKVSGLAISADDSDALVPTGKAAMAAGIPVVTWDSAIGKDGRTIHINQAEAAGIADVQLKMALDLTGPDGGDIAILSATSTAPNQNEWIGLMKEALKKPEYAKLKLVDTVYGDDDDTKSYNEAQGLFKKYPNLKVIIAPTTVGIAASARAVQDAKLVGKVLVTGLGTPNQMREYVKSGAVARSRVSRATSSPPASWVTTRSILTAPCCWVCRSSTTKTTSTSSTGNLTLTPLLSFHSGEGNPRMNT